MRNKSQATPAAPTAASSIDAGCFEFGPGSYRLEIATRSLFRAGEFLPLTPKVAETLLLLLEQAGRVVTKEQLLERVWPGVVVEEGGIANNISALRKLLKADLGEDGLIATVARRGYRFTGEVRLVDKDALTQTTPDARPAPAPMPKSTPAARASSPNAPRESILVADIENRTGDALFDDTIKQALMMNLAQSPLLDILTDRKVHSMLLMMERLGQPVTGEIALEICQRTGTRAAITGSIFSLGEEFAIGLYAIHGESGAILVSEQSRARGKGEVLQALDRAAQGLREKLGESLASVRRHSLQFDEVATSSLEALRAYSLGRRQWLEHGEVAAMPHFLRALELDPQFVSTYSALALCCANMGDNANACAYMTRAFDMRGRATERERGRIQGMYHQIVTGDLYKGLDAYRAWQDIYPNDASIAQINSGHFYALLGQWDKAEECAQRARQLENTSIITSNLALAQLALGKREAARHTLEDALASGFEAFSIHLDAYHEAFLRDDPAGMQRHVNAVSGRAGEEDFLIAAQADTEAFHGRFARARELSARAVESARRAGALEMAAIWQALSALREAEIGNDELARNGAQAALEISTGQQIDTLVAMTLARSGDVGRAAQIADALDRDFRQNTQLQRYWLPSIHAAIALRGNDPLTALKVLDAAVALDLALSLPLEIGLMYPPWLRAQAALQLGRFTECERDFRKIIGHPGLIRNFVVYPLAIAGYAHMLRADGRDDDAKDVHETFIELWKDRDAELAHVDANPVNSRD